MGKIGIMTLGKKLRQMNRRWEEYEKKKLGEYEEFTDQISIMKKGDSQPLRARRAGFRITSPL